WDRPARARAGHRRGDRPFSDEGDRTRAATPLPDGRRSARSDQEAAYMVVQASRLHYATPAIAASTIAALSTREHREPRFTNSQPADAALAISSFANPPSGPTATASRGLSFLRSGSKRLAGVIAPSAGWASQRSCGSSALMQ